MSKQSINALEGRARLARPSVCLLLLAALLLVPAFAATVAQAALPTPLVLGHTIPESSLSFPANSTTPLIVGGEEGSITTGIKHGPHRSAITSAGGAGNEVLIYTNSTCTGTPVATGDLGELEHDGIEVVVLPDSTTTFYASQLEAGEPLPSKCSTPGLTYRESSTVITPPIEPPGGGAGGPGGEGGASGAAPSAPHLRAVPGHRANDNTPQITGDAPGAGAVKVFPNANCSGAPVASGSTAEFATGFTVQVPDNTTATFSGIAVSAGKQSPCSMPITYVEDSTPPRTRITMGPGAKTHKHKAVFRFADTTDDPLGTTFLCKVNHAKWKQCGSPFKLRHLHVKRYVLRVKATDSAGNVEATATKRRFKVIRRA